MTKFIAIQLIKMRRRQTKFLKFLTTVVRFFVSGSPVIRGCRIVVSGRINGHLRARSFIIQVGVLPRQQFDIKFHYVFDVAYTRFGTYGIKV